MKLVRPKVNYYRKRMKSFSLGKMAIPSKISGVNLTDFLGQLLVVVHHTSASSSLCYEPELIPDPLGRSLMSYAHLMDLGSGVVSCGI